MTPDHASPQIAATTDPHFERARALLPRFQALLGPAGIIEAPADLAPFCADWRGREPGSAPFALLPASTAECVAIVRLCAEARLPLCPQGGNTGLVLGAVPDGEIVVSLRRMNRIRAVDLVNDTLVADAGVVLANVQTAADNAGRLFPLSLAAEGSAQIGGLCATNAGGVGVLHYGMMRDLVLGLEVVLPDGRILDALTGLRKDNTGYDLKQLFLGAEGTLGIITAASLKLFARPKGYATAMVGVPDLATALALLTFLKSEGENPLTMFEAMPAAGLRITHEQFPALRPPLDGAHAWHILVEQSLFSATPDPAALESLLAKSMEQGLAQDAVIARNEAQRLAFRAIREHLPLAEKAFGEAIKHDISVPISAIAQFYDAACAAIADIAPEALIIAFGHLGDGNLHFNAARAPGADAAEFATKAAAITRVAHDCVAEFGGSFSAEHGIGRQKRAELAARKSPEALALMRALKAAIDPLGIMNPGRIV